MISDEVRALIVSQLREGRSVPQLVSTFASVCGKATLYRVAKDFRAGREERVEKAQKQPWRKIDPKMAATIIRRLTINKAQHSLRGVAKQFELAPNSIQNLLKRKGLNCFKKRKRNRIPKTQQVKRKFCCMNFRKAYRSSDLPNFLYVDECYFTVQKSFNHQNERCYGKDFESIPDFKKFRQLPKTPLSAMVFAGVSREGRTPLVVLRSGFRLNQYTYVDECIDFVKDNLPSDLNAESVIFYQDKAPCHAAASVQQYLAAIFPSFILNGCMPPNSPDLNVLDYCVWSLLKERVNK